jgi:excisionase family DNA binding protein
MTDAERDARRAKLDADRAAALARALSKSWITLTEGAAYSNKGKRYLRQAIAAKQLRAAKVGGRGDNLLRKEWIDQWLEDLATPVVVSSGRRFAG